MDTAQTEKLKALALAAGGDTILKGIPKYEWYLMDRDDTEYYKVADIEIFVSGVEKDAMRWRFRKQFLASGGAIMFTVSGCQLRRTGELVASGENEEAAIDAAIAASKEKA